MAAVVRMPAALAGVTEAAVQTWIAKPGQTIAVGDVLAEIETEKAVVAYEAEVAGTVGRILVGEGESTEVGAPIAVILEAGEGDDAIAPALAAAGVAAAPIPAPATAPAAGAVGTPEKLAGMRKAIVRRLTESKTTVPHFYVTAHCRVDRLLALRAQVNEAAPRKVSVNDFVLKAVAGALVDVPAGRLQQRELEDGRLAVGTVMTVTLSADHRIIDGAVAAEWMAAFVRRIENPVSALL
ncbi:MAG: hypothetical protein EAS51_12960 [Microbacteriaceae bacterium]|nr:MAG: hypothetical protein EAS51_12960 [Microbacteriaceae bacterium]